MCPRFNAGALWIDNQLSPHRVTGSDRCHHIANRLAPTTAIDRNTTKPTRVRSNERDIIQRRFVNKFWLFQNTDQDDHIKETLMFRRYKNLTVGHIAANFGFQSNHPIRSPAHPATINHGRHPRTAPIKSRPRRKGHCKKHQRQIHLRTKQQGPDPLHHRAHHENARKARDAAARVDTKATAAATNGTMAGNTQWNP